MDRYQHCFQQLQQKNEGAFVPFVTLCDPNPQLSHQVIEALIAGGADALELGMPFSDPLADGPTIQSANQRALEAGATSTDCFTLLQQIRDKHPTIPMGLLVYANLVFNQGIEQFYARCAAAGVDSVLVADVPLDEAQPFRDAALKHNIAPIFICPPNGTPELIAQIAESGRGYTYLLSRAGVTGAENRASVSLHQQVEQLKQHNAPPAIQGFGISEPQQVRQVLLAGATGAISGSAVVKLIEKHLNEPQQMLQALTEFTREMKAATRNLQ
ncbi:MAG: tryptophan synthase subunit alpha [Enterobacteriaceae bacterium]